MSRSCYALFGASIIRLAREFLTRSFNQKCVHCHTLKYHGPEHSVIQTEHENALYTLLIPILLQIR